MLVVLVVVVMMMVVKRCFVSRSPGKIGAKPRAPLARKMSIQRASAPRDTSIMRIHGVKTRRSGVLGFFFAHDLDLPLTTRRRLLDCKKREKKPLFSFLFFFWTEAISSSSSTLPRFLCDPIGCNQQTPPFSGSAAHG